MTPFEKVERILFVLDKSMNATPSILHLPVRLVRGFTADTDECRALIAHRSACATARRERAEEEDRMAMALAHYEHHRGFITAQADGD